MPRSSRPRQPAANQEPFIENIIDIDVSTEMEDSFLEYAYSVIYSRALPDARDGMKPVQRRILFQMAQMGLRPDRAHVKSSRVIGEVMGKLHPHGDSSIYDALVRMAQPFSLRVPLVDGHGNFGSLDDGAAAPRYTEARLSTAAMAMTDDLSEDVVDFTPNYDGQFLQPEVLPSAIPNLLVNGASGIAVGMATNMAPHNLGEVIAAARHLIKHPDASLSALMRYVPGPDLPSGGTIVGLDGIKDAYRTGRGLFRTRAKVNIESVTARKKGLVVTELPYLVGPEKVMEKISAAVQSKKLQGISDAADFTDREQGLRLVIEVKNGFNPEAVLEQLYKLTPMEDSFGINNVALVNGQPRTLGLKELLEVYVNHRLSVVRRRTAYRLSQRQKRLHLVEGLLIAILDIDEVIEVIRSSDDGDSARTRLMKVFSLSTEQAEYILELRLRRLTKFSRIELETERDELRKEIESLSAILADDDLLRQVTSDELAAVAKRFASPRRTVLLESAAAPTTAAAMPLEVENTPCWAVLTSTGLVARLPLGEQEHDQAASISRTGDRVAHDAIRSSVQTSVRAEIGAITSRGRVARISVLELPSLPPTDGAPSVARGHPITEYVALAADEEVVALVSFAAGAPPIALGTRNGVVKRVQPDWPNKDEWEVIALRDQDTVVGAGHAADNDELVFISDDAHLLHFAASLVRPQGRTAGGMAGIKLSTNAHVIAFQVVSSLDDNEVVTIAGSSGALRGTQTGSAKRTPLIDFPAKGRATGGVRAHRFLKGEDLLILAWAGQAPARAVSAEGKPITLPEELGKRDGSGVSLTTAVAALG